MNPFDDLLGQTLAFTHGQEIHALQRINDEITDEAELVVPIVDRLAVRRCIENSSDIQIENLLERLHFILLETRDSAFPHKGNLASGNRIRSEDHEVIEIPHGEKRIFVFLARAMNFVEFSAHHFGFFKSGLCRESVHFFDERVVDIFIASFNECDRLVHVLEIAAPVDVVVTGTRARVHLEIETIRMWVITADVIEAGPQLERPLERCLQPCELSAGDEWTEVIHAGFDLPAHVDSREALLPIDLHEREQSERAHLPIRLREMTFSFLVEDVEGFERGVGLDVLDSSGYLAQIKIADALGSLAVVAKESLEEIARLIENDQLTPNIEDFINAGMLGQGRQRSIVFDRLEPELHEEL